jgi:parallel beta-helix repeat protein
VGTLKKANKIILALLVIFSSLITVYGVKMMLPPFGDSISVPWDYPTIQMAVDRASSGDTIYIHSGIYLGGISFTKSVSLIGDGALTTIIAGGAVLDTLSASQNGSGQGRFEISTCNMYHPTTTVMRVNASDVRISGLTFQGGDEGLVVLGNNVQINDVKGKISLTGNCCTVSRCSDALTFRGNNCTVTHCSGVLTMQYAFNCKVYSNTLIQISMEGSNNNTITNNTLTGATEGFYIGRWGVACSYNIIAGNTIDKAHLWGLLMGFGSYNIFYGNLISNTGEGLTYSGYGLALGSTTSNSAENNIFVHNSFINNRQNVDKNWPTYGHNYWDFAGEGNYWDDYVGESGGASYVIDSFNVDHHPLVKQPALSDSVPEQLKLWPAT